MEEIKKALFQQMRFNIMKTAINGLEESPFCSAYIYAWDDGVYPLFNNGAQWHLPHKDQFQISEEKVEELSKYLDDLWIEKKSITFYELEEHFGVHGSSHTTGVWDRWSLIITCRYMFLQGLFDDEFWGKLIENTKCPSEAFSICREFKASDIYFN